MWVPRTWHEIEALIGSAEETRSLEFKRLIGQGREIAKDLAAMTVNGGVLLYGIDEDKKTRVAVGAPKVPVAGQEERLRQIASTVIRPAPAFDTVTIREADGDTDGVIAVVVPPSPLAPHEVDGRFPRRDGTVTAYLSEPEIERLYRLRRHAGGPPARAADLLDIAEHLPGMDPVKARNTAGRHVGMIRVACGLAGDVRHPADPWLQDVLDHAVDRADAWFAPKASTGRPFLLEHLDARGWQPDGVDGWIAGRVHDDAPTLLKGLTAAAVLRYPSHLLMQITLPLSAEADGNGYLDYDCAYEWLVIREVLAGLVIAGYWADGFEAAGQVQIAVQLAGFAGAAPYAFTRALKGIDPSTMPAAPPGITSTTPTTAAELCQAPDTVARGLIDRWLAAFYRGHDVYSIVLS